MRFARTPRLNIATLALTLLPGIALLGGTFLVPGLGTWVKVIGILLFLMLLSQAFKLRGNWNLWADLGPDGLSYGRGKTLRTIAYADIAELFILEPRRYRVVLADRSSETIDLRTLYHAGQAMDRHLAEAVTRQWMGKHAQDLMKPTTHRFGPIAVHMGASSTVEVGDFQVSMVDADLVLGNLFVTVANAATKQTRVVARHLIPNLHTLAMLVTVMKT